MSGIRRTDNHGSVMVPHPVMADGPGSVRFDSVTVTLAHAPVALVGCQQRLLGAGHDVSPDAVATGVGEHPLPVVLALRPFPDVFQLLQVVNVHAMAVALAVDEGALVVREVAPAVGALSVSLVLHELAFVNSRLRRESAGLRRARSSRSLGVGRLGRLPGVHARAMALPVLVQALVDVAVPHDAPAVAVPPPMIPPADVLVDGRLRHGSDVAERAVAPVRQAAGCWEDRSCVNARAALRIERARV
mmetsp:Transcript_6225/g.18398  ORF Transcript_6225/g.18398 Transcript_6225/m.18398 type:complete len:246 (-) Transcript_6225:331-1068(-)